MQSFIALFPALLQRPGAFAVYLEPWHSDVFDFLELKKNTGKEEQRARDLFFAMWIPDLFMKRVENNQVNTGGNLYTLHSPRAALYSIICSVGVSNCSSLAAVGMVPDVSQ